jgi:hypothetical protein
VGQTTPFVKGVSLRVPTKAWSHSSAALAGLTRLVQLLSSWLRKLHDTAGAYFEVMLQTLGTDFIWSEDGVVQQQEGS